MTRTSICIDFFVCEASGRNTRRLSCPPSGYTLPAHQQGQLHAALEMVLGGIRVVSGVNILGCFTVGSKRLPSLAKPTFSWQKVWQVKSTSLHCENVHNIELAKRLRGEKLDECSGNPSATTTSLSEQREQIQARCHGGAPGGNHIAISCGVRFYVTYFGSPRGNTIG